MSESRTQGGVTALCATIGDLHTFCTREAANLPIAISTVQGSHGEELETTVDTRLSARCSSAKVKQLEQHVLLSCLHNLVAQRCLALEAADTIPSAMLEIIATRYVGARVGPLREETAEFALITIEPTVEQRSHSWPFWWNICDWVI